MDTLMYHLNNAVSQIRPDAKALAAATPLTSKTAEQLPAVSAAGLEYYNSIFGSSVADSHDKRLECFKIRYQVYCIDNAFEDPADNPDGHEIDCFDSRSAHSLLTHR